MNETINEVLQYYKGDYTDIEVYRFTEPSTYYGGKIHTDRIDYIGEELTIDYNKTFRLDCQLMDEEEYNNTVLANAGEYFTDFYNPSDKILVIILFDTYIIDDVVYNQEEWDKMHS